MLHGVEPAPVIDGPVTRLQTALAALYSRSISATRISTRSRRLTQWPTAL